jgi:hypothetical protein
MRVAGAAAAAAAAIWLWSLIPVCKTERDACIYETGR